MIPLSLMQARLLALALTLASPLAQAVDVQPPPGPADTTCLGSCGISAADGDITLSPLAKPMFGWVSTFGSSELGVSPLALGGNKTGAETNGSRVRTGAFAALAGDQLNIYLNYVSTDGKGYDDYAWARLIDAGSASTVAWLFTARSTNSGTRNIVPGDVVDKSDFDPDTALVGYDAWDFTSKTAVDPVNWAPLGDSNGLCWEDNAKGCGFTGWMHARHTLAASGSYRLEFGVVNWGDQAYDSGLAFDYAGLRALPLAAPVPEPSGLLLMALGLLAAPLAVRRPLRFKA